MGTLYDHCQRIQRHIEQNGLDVFKTRGAIALEAGFLITLIEPDTPDDPVKMKALEGAAEQVLGIRLL